MSQDLYDRIPEIMDSFDFKKTLIVMRFLNWTWGGRHPMIDDLKETAKDLLTSTVDRFIAHGCPKTGALTATGGFEATVVVYESGKTSLKLLFYVDSRDR